MTEYTFKIKTRNKPRGEAYYLYLPLDEPLPGHTRARVIRHLGYVHEMTEEQAYDEALNHIQAIREKQKAPSTPTPTMVVLPASPGEKILQDGIALYWQVQTIKGMTDEARPKSIINNFLLPFFKTFPLIHYTGQMGLDYVQWRKDQGIALSTIRREWGVMNRILNLCVAEKWIPANPMGIVSDNLPKPEGRSRIVSHDELELIYQHAMPEVWRAVLAALHVGLRESKTLAVQDTWLWMEESWDWLLVPKATTRYKRNPLKQPLNRIGMKALFPSEGTMPKGRIFSRWKDGNSFRTMWDKVMSRAGIEDLHFNDLRHTFATRLENEGVDYYLIQLLLGHKMKGVTPTYLHGGKGLEKRLQEAVRSLEKYEVDVRVDASASPKNRKYVQVIENVGAEAQNRTADTSLFRAVLYQLSYLGTSFSLKPTTMIVQKRPMCVPRFYL